MSNFASRVADLSRQIDQWSELEKRTGPNSPQTHTHLRHMAKTALDVMCLWALEIETQTDLLQKIVNHIERKGLT
jgi:hypothetical protein